MPLGTAVGNAFGWRAAFVMIAGFTLLAAAAIAAFVPEAAGPRSRMPLAGQLRALANRRVLGAYAMIVLLMIAFFSLLTFIAPYLAEVVGVGADRLPAILMALGVAGGVGMFAGGALTDLNPNRSLVAGFALAAAALALAWAAMPRSAAVGVAAVAALELLGSVAALAAQHRVLVGAFRAPELASTLMSSVFNLGIALGAGLGAWALAAGMPVARLPLIGLVALVAGRVDCRRGGARRPADALNLRRPRPTFAGADRGRQRWRRRRRPTR